MRALEMGHICPRELYEMNLEGGSFTGDPEGYAKYRSGNGRLFP